MSDRFGVKIQPFNQLENYMFDASTVRLKGRKHPMLVGLDNYSKTLTDLSKAIGVTPQSVNSWKQRAIQDRHFLLPAERVPGIARELGMPRSAFRPDLWEVA